ncbi:MAG TPA: hypothetical protein VLH19_04825 [Patescibacteria group bacterium]|nr:hypothetical protein [Patescibacteria group bacterium]
MPKSASLPQIEKQLKQRQKALEKAQDELKNELILSLNKIDRKEIPEPKEEPISIEDELARREKLKNEDLAQDIKLKSFTIKALFIFLAIETLVVFIFMLFQALGRTLVIGEFSFHLDEWGFRVMIGATITQITVMLKIAIEYLFPKRNQ